MNYCNKSRTETANKAAEYFLNGFHCAESVVRATMEHMDKEPDCLVRCATPFGGGYGKTFQGTCGALSGSLLVIGHLHGRSEAGKSWEYSATLAEIIRSKFLEKYGTTTCIDLRERFGPETQQKKCSEIVNWISRELLDEIDT